MPLSIGDREIRLLAGTQLRLSTKFFDQVLDYPECLCIDSKLQFLKMMQNLVDVINQTRHLRKNQDAERAGKIKVGGVRMPQRDKIVKYKRTVRRFQTESQYLLFSFAQACNERQQRAVLHWSHCNPPKFRQLWQIDSTPSAFSQFRCYGWGRVHRSEKLRQQMNQAYLMQILQRRRVTYNVAHSLHLYGAHLPTLQTYSRRSPPI